MTNPAFLVDGIQEQKIVQALCVGTPVRLLNCNGSDVAVAAAARRAASLIRLFGGKYYPIVIIYDRENRAQSAEQLAVELAQNIKEQEINDSLIIGIPDRMIENWILADWGNIKSKTGFSGARPTELFEGKGGKSQIGKLLSREQNYRETIHGVEWFMSGSPVVMMENSASFKKFASQLKNIGCRWLLPCFDEGHPA